MNLEQLQARAQEIENAIINTAAQLNALNGHKAETMHWIQRLQEAQNAENSTLVEQPVESVVE